MPLGDSITDGVGGPAGGGGYRIPLFSTAHADGKNITFVGRQHNGPDTVDGAPFPRDHEGYSGYTVQQSTDLALGALSAGNPHIILLMIGTNDVNWADPEGVPGRLAVLLDLLVDNAPDTLLVVAKIIPLRWDNASLTEYNAQIPGLVQARADQGHHIVMVDMYEGFPADGLASDGVHPNETGYAFMGDVWYEAIRDLLP